MTIRPSSSLKGLIRLSWEKTRDSASIQQWPNLETDNHNNTTLGKSDGGCDEEKLKANTIIPINLLERPSPLKVYRHTEFERIGRLSWNRAKDSKGILGLVSVMQQTRSGKILFKANLKKQEEKYQYVAVSGLRKCHADTP